MTGDYQPTQIISLELDRDSFAWLNELRQRHFPPAINYLDAHLTLFHKVDEQGCAVIARTLIDLLGSCASALHFEPLSQRGGVTTLLASASRNAVSRFVDQRLWNEFKKER